MVNTVVVEKPQLLSAEDRLSQSGLSAQVGLLIGKLSPTLDRGFIFDFIPTPQNDAGEAACSVSKDDKKKPPSKSKSQPSDSISLVIDKDWIAEHARQVSRMLLGGIKVVGIYVWATDSAFKNSTIELCQTVNAAAKAVPILEIDSDERLLVHIGYSPRRYTCRNCTITSNITSSCLRPCDLKTGLVLKTLRTFKCTYNFSLRLPIRLVGASNTQTFSDILRQGISVHANELRGAKAVVDGNFVVNDEPCSTDGLHEVELLLPLLNDTSAEACSQKDVVGLLILSGSVCSFAFLTPKEPISQAFSEIKGDIIMSLQSRLDVICDEVDEDLAPTASGGEEASNEKPVSKLILHSLRLKFVLKEHCVELMSMEALSDSSSILDVEVEAPSVISKSFWDVVVPFSSGGSSSSSASKGIETSKEKTEYPVKTANFNIMAAVFFLLLSILVGFVLIAKKL
ncbi:Oxidoreductase zinc-binding dehydrogenase family protein [Citrus sinensis]|uniref:Oxidoreductase zinc-binding dehydrogenase family protein n=1 Tax=Citrus sinensis TaxID=2711 RepID=A0ACB8KNY2_CITSI|nr:Oxidoreductase zinc-binding dehydrogenase family protein [Citrus sinensis]